MRRCAGQGTRGFFRLSLALVALTTMGWATSSAAELPDPEQLPRGIVARIAEAPGGAGFVTQREFRRALAQETATTGLDHVPAPGSRRYERLKREAIDALLERAWLRGQAAEMHIRIRPRQIARRLAGIIRESFRSRAEYRRFLRQARLTPRDVWKQVEIQVLSSRVERRVVRGAPSEAAALRALDTFVDTFEERWRERTVCAPKYVVARCSNGALSARRTPAMTAGGGGAAPKAQE